MTQRLHTLMVKKLAHFSVLNDFVIVFIQRCVYGYPLDKGETVIVYVSTWLVYCIQLFNQALTQVMVYARCS